MFNLLVNFKDVWTSKEGIAEVWGGRFLISTKEDLKVNLIDANGMPKNILTQIPTLFVTEGEKIKSKIGKITQIDKQNDGGVRYKYKIINSIKPAVLETLLLELDLGKYELTSTHWAVKNENLLEVLLKNKVITKKKRDQIQLVFDDGVSTDMLENFSGDEKFSDLIISLKNAIEKKEFHLVHDRLHTYCVNKFRYLIKLHGGEVSDKNEPLHGLFGRYFKLIKSQLNPTCSSFLDLSKKFFDKYNHVRNNASFAHDNEVLAGAEAQYIFETIAALLRFIKSIEKANYEK